jgi:putative protein-disulfide isomerase
MYLCCMTPTIYYCYDAYCGWCYGFSSVIKQLAAAYEPQYPFEVLSGGMIITDTPRPIKATAAYIREAYKTVESHTGVKFGDDYLWHIFNPEESDWFPSSEKPAIALSVLKEIVPEKQVAFATDLQYALHYEGRDLCDNEAYRHLLEKYGLPEKTFYDKLGDPVYKEKAQYEFALCKQLNVTGFPTLFLQVSDTRLYLLARGYTPFDEIVNRLDEIVLKEDLH